MNEQSLKDRIKIIAKEKKIHFNECWKKLLLERFLLRLSKSRHEKNFIFKGGFLLAYIIEIGRETIDLDFLLTKMNASEQEIKKTIIEIISTKSADGFLFKYESTTPLTQPHMKYPGFRIHLTVSFGRMKDRIHIDVGTGDIVSPKTKNLNLVQYRNKPLFESQISLLVYPPETIFAEKLETIISKGAANSRMKDYHDLFLLSRKLYLMNFDTLHYTIKETFHHRDTNFELIEFSSQDIKPLNQLWTAHLKNLGGVAESMKLPKDIQDVINEINQVLTHSVIEGSIKL